MLVLSLRPERVNCLLRSTYGIHAFVFEYLITPQMAAYRLALWELSEKISAALHTRNSQELNYNDDNSMDIEKGNN